MSVLPFFASLSLLLSMQIYYGAVNAANGRDYWTNTAEEDIKAAVNRRWNGNTAKNVIVFIGDGMSQDTITTTRIYYKGENGYLAWEKFPHTGLLKTYNEDRYVPDSASTATALFTGVKTNTKVVGVDANVKLGDCEASLLKENHLQSILDWALAAGKDAGFVTTTRVTHATPAPLYGHSASREWECENKMPESAKNCKDLAHQLIEQEPGKSLKVIMGGGRQILKSNVTGTDYDPVDTWACYSTDGRDLLRDWAEDKKARRLSHKIVQNNEELQNLDHENVDYVLGVFANGHITMDWERETGPLGQPSLENMTVTALKVLSNSQQSPNGYVLVVEGGLIDFAHHRGHAVQALRETARLSEAIEATLALIDISDTLVIVTSDHTHSMVITGQPLRGESIVGIGQSSAYDHIPFTNLLYVTGGPNNMAYTYNETTGSVTRIDPSNDDVESFNYSQQAVVITNEAGHGGADVAVYAIGPWAHLFYSTHEQNYVAYVISYAAKIGPYLTVPYASGADNHSTKWSVIIITMVSAFLPMIINSYQCDSKRSM